MLTESQDPRYHSGPWGQRGKANRKKSGISNKAKKKKNSIPPSQEKRRNEVWVRGIAWLGAQLGKGYPQFELVKSAPSGWM